jgi:hypothetical protein
MGRGYLSDKLYRRGLRPGGKARLMNSIKISVVKKVGKAFSEIAGGNVNLDKVIKDDALTVKDDIRTFTDRHLTLRVLYGYPEPMFLVDDVIKIGIIKDPQTAIDKAQETASSVFMYTKVNYEGFEDKEYVFTNFRGACAMAMSSFRDNPYQAAFSMNEILDFIEHAFLGAIEQELGINSGRRAKARRSNINTEKGGK